MNIIISKELHDNLQKYVVSTIEFGSKLKGESTNESDKDLLHIVESADWWTSSVIANQHLLQYKTENVDHIYCNAHTFVKSLLDGDTTIFVEMHRYGALKNTCLEFLNNYNFVSYRTLRAYLGIARRDMKDIKKLWKTKNFRKMNKKIKFTNKGLSFVLLNLNDALISTKNLDNSYLNIMEKMNNEHNNIFKDNINLENYNYDQMNDLIESIINLSDSIRSFLNSLIELNLIKKTLNEDTFMRLISDLNSNITVKSCMKECENEVMSCFYNSYIGNI